MNLFRSPQEGVIIFESFNGRSVSDSPLAIYRYLLEKERYSNLSFIWVIDSPDNDIMSFIESQPRTRVVFYKTREYLRGYRSASIWVTNSRLPKSLVKSNNQVYLQCWHGTPIKRLGCDILKTTDTSLSQLARNYLYVKQSTDVDFFLSSSPYASDRFMSAFGLSKEQILETGYPRCDKLVTGVPAMDVSMIKSILGIPKENKVILYAPTYRDEVFSPNFSSCSSEDPIYSILESINGCSEGITLLYRGHYFSYTLSNREGIIDVSKYNDVNDLLNITDVLITDYSSIMFDFALTGRAIICYLYDLISYKDDSRGLYIDIDDSFPCMRVNTRNELKLAILKSLRVNGIDERNYVRFNKIFNPYEDGKSSMRVVEELFKVSRKI